MSLVIAIKDKGRFVLGADKQASIGNKKEHAATKVWEVVGYPGCAMGSVGYARCSQIMQYAGGLIDKNLVSIDEINEEYVVGILTETIRATLTKYGITSEIKLEDGTGYISHPAIPNSFIFCCQDRGWVINADLSVVEIEDYVAIGSGAEVARGALFATKDKNVFERIVLAIDAAAEETMYVDNSVEIALTEELPEDQKDYYSALGIEIKKTTKKNKKKEPKQ